MDGIKGFIDKMQLDRDFRRSLREAETKEEKIKIIRQAGFDVSEKDIKKVVESISRIADENFHVRGNNYFDCGAGSCKEPTNCGCSPMCMGPCTADEKTSNNTRISIDIEEDKRNN